MYSGPLRGPCIGVIYTHPSRVGGIQAMILSYSLSNSNFCESLLFSSCSDICDAVERLLSENEILIKNFSFKNLYIAKEIAPRILIVITEGSILHS